MTWIQPIQRVEQFQPSRLFDFGIVCGFLACLVSLAPHSLNIDGTCETVKKNPLLTDVTFALLATRYACRSGDTAMVQLLLRCGATPTLRDATRMTAYMYAVPPLWSALLQPCFPHCRYSRALLTARCVLAHKKAVNLCACHVRNLMMANANLVLLGGVQQQWCAAGAAAQVRHVRQRPGQCWPVNHTLY